MKRITLASRSCGSWATPKRSYWLCCGKTEGVAAADGTTSYTVVKEAEGRGNVEHIECDRVLAKLDDEQNWCMELTLWKQSS